jgi:hypothetical protein
VGSLTRGLTEPLTTNFPFNEWNGVPFVRGFEQPRPGDNNLLDYLWPGSNCSTAPNGASAQSLLGGASATASFQAPSAGQTGGVAGFSGSTQVGNMLGGNNSLLEQAAQASSQLEDSYTADNLSIPAGSTSLSITETYDVLSASGFDASHPADWWLINIYGSDLNCEGPGVPFGVLNEVRTGGEETPGSHTATGTYTCPPGEVLAPLENSPVGVTAELATAMGLQSGPGQSDSASLSVDLEGASYTFSS